MDYKSNGSHLYMGETLLTVNDFHARGRKSWEFKSPSTNKFVGNLILLNHTKEINYAFVDYLRGGMEISLITCIDFTGSNGIPSSPSSLHFLQNVDNLDDQRTLNDYQKAILSVGNILLNYDSDKLVQTYGFGAKPKINGQMQTTSHFFPCSGDYTNCSGVGVEGIFKLYSNALQNIELSGPTYFAPLLQQVRTFTEENFKQDTDSYTVLLILTDGVIHDMSATIDNVVHASRLPLSIIIVGIGNENFEMMEQLDSDNKVSQFS